MDTHIAHVIQTAWDVQLERAPPQAPTPHRNSAGAPAVTAAPTPTQLAGAQAVAALQRLGLAPVGSAQLPATNSGAAMSAPTAAKLPPIAAVAPVAGLQHCADLHPAAGTPQQQLHGDGPQCTHKPAVGVGNSTQPAPNLPAAHDGSTSGSEQAHAASHTTDFTDWRGSSSSDGGMLRAGG